MRAGIARSGGPARRCGVSTETARERRKRGPAERRDRSGRPHEPPRKASGEGRAVVRGLRRATGFPPDGPTFAVRRFLPRLGRDDVRRLLEAAGPSRRPAPAGPGTPAGGLEEYGPGSVRVDVKRLPEPRASGGEPRERFPSVAVGRRPRPVHPAVEGDGTEAGAAAFPREVPAAFPFRVTRPPADRGGRFTADGLEEPCRELGVGHRETGPCTPRTDGTVGRFDGRVRREALGVTVAGHRDPGRPPEGLDRAHDARRQRVLPAASGCRTGAHRRRSSASARRRTGASPVPATARRPVRAPSPGRGS